MESVIVRQPRLPPCTLLLDSRSLSVNLSHEQILNLGLKLREPECGIGAGDPPSLQPAVDPDLAEPPIRLVWSKCLNSCGRAMRSRLRHGDGE